MTTFKFAVPCAYTYEIQAQSEDEARKILQGKAAYIDAFDNNVKKEYQRMADAKDQRLIFGISKGGLSV